METITGTVNRLIYESQQNDFKVFMLKKKDRSVIRITGNFPQVIYGAKIELHGAFNTHPKYGLAFKADAHTYSYEKTAESLCLYIQSIAKWVGPQRSYAIAEKFGDQIEEIIERTPEKLTEIDGIGEKVAISIADAWKLNANMKDIQVFLHGLGLGVAKIKRIITMFGAETEDILMENPWILCGHGFGFTTCDHIANKLGKDMRDGFRYKQFILYTLRMVSNSGHLFLFPSQFLAAFNKYNSKSDYPFKGGEITLEDIAPYVRELVYNAELINDNNRIYELSSFFFENESARQIIKMFETKSSCKLDPNKVDEFIKRYERQHTIDESKPFKLSDMQADAVRSFFKEKILVITGGPGTGKTEITKAFVQILKEHGISFELMAPTGIAAKKLGNTAGHEAYTIHRRLGYKGDRWDYNNSNKYTTDVVIVDEVSMVDQEVFYRLISSLYSSTKIVFVGDNDQLPSVGPGCVLKELINSKLFKTIFLNKIFRQKKTSEIILEAKKIRDGDTDLTYFRSEKEADIWHISDRDEKRIENLIIRFAQQLKNTAKDKKKISFQIITPRNDGPLSVYSLNTALQQALNPHDPDCKELKLENSVIRVGDRVIIKKNNYEYEVFNGDVGKVISITPYSIVVDVEDFYDTSKRIELPIKIAEEMLKLAYCLTVHKCLPKGTLIYTDNGLLPIEEIKKGNYVLTHKNCFKKVIWSDVTGKKPIIQFTTKTQSFFESSPTHGFLISSGNYPFFLEANDIKIGDFVCVSRKVCKGIDIPIVYNGNNTYMGRKVITLPLYIDIDMAWIIGALIGDGCYTDMVDGTIEFSGPSKIELIDKAKKILSTYGLNVREHNRKGKRHTIYVVSKNFRDFLYTIGLGYVKARKKTVPDLFFKCGIKERASLISGLFDTDGSVSKNGNIRFRTSSRKLAIDIKNILGSLGIISFFNQEKSHSYLISIFGSDSIRFREIITLHHSDKKNRLDNYILSHNSKSNHYEIPYGRSIIKSFMNNFKEKEGNSRGIKGKGFYSKYPSECRKCWLILRNKNKCRLPLLLRLNEIAETEGVSIPSLMKDCIEDNYYFDKIIHIENKKELVEMREIEVEEDHSYCSPAFICHNCQGSEYSIVILPLIKAHGNLLLQRNLLYTAITRAKKKVVLIGQTSAIEQAINNDKIQKRNTLLAERINQWTTGTGISLRNMFSHSSASQDNKLLERLLLLEEGSS